MPRTCNTEVSSTDFHTTNLVDVINCDQRTSNTTKVVGDTAYASASALSWTRTTVEMDISTDQGRRQSRML